MIFVYNTIYNGTEFYVDKIIVYAEPTEIKKAQDVIKRYNKSGRKTDLKHGGSESETNDEFDMSETNDGFDMSESNDGFDGGDVKFDDVTFDDVEFDNIDEKNTHVKTTRPKKPAGHPHAVLSEFRLIPAETLWSFQFKLAVDACVPVYLQHISHDGTPIGYDYISNIPTEIDITKLQTPEKIDLFPIFPSQNFSYTQIVQKTTTTPVSSLPRHMNVYSLEDFTTDQANYSEQTIQIIYRGFVYRFFPQMNERMLFDYLSGVFNASDYPLFKQPQRHILLKQNARLVEIYTSQITKLLKSKEITYSVDNVNASFLLNVVNTEILFDKMHTGKCVRTVQMNKHVDGVEYAIVKHRGKYTVASIQQNSLFIVHDGGTVSFRSGQGTILIRIDIESSKNNVVEQVSDKIETVLSHIIPYPIHDLSINEYAINIYWKRTFSTETFSLVTSEIERLVTLGIFSRVGSDENMYEVAYNMLYRGLSPQKYQKMLQLQNGYSFLSSINDNELYRSIIKNKTIRFTHRLSDVLIEINGATTEEVSVCVEFILKFIANTSDLYRDTITQNKIKKIKKLRQYDPALYAISDASGKNIYSKISQEQFQPVIYSEREVEQLPKNIRARLFKYWNFTYNEPIWYDCPNRAYPNIRFIVGKHPLNYCIPQCKKKSSNMGEVNNPNSVYNKCRRNHVYTDEKKLSRTRYIMQYGKQIPPQKISQLPQQLNQLLNEDMNEYITQKLQCVKNAGYFLYGVSANVGCINTSIISILLDVFGVTIEEFIQRVKGIFRETPAIYENIIGECSNYISLDEFLGAFTGNCVECDIEWRVVIEKIAKYMDVTIIRFKDTGNDIVLDIPSGVLSSDDVMTTNRYVVVVENSGIDYPVYILSLNEFYRDGSIIKTNYDIADPIIQQIKIIINSSSVVDASFSLSAELVSDPYTITQQFVNNLNMTYGFEIQHKRKRTQFYLGVDMRKSTYEHPRCYKFPNPKKYSGAELYAFLGRVIPRDISVLYKTIKYNGNTVGLQTTLLGRQINHYFSQQYPSTRWDVIELLYDPIKFGQAILDKCPPRDLSAEYTSAVYKKNMYYLVLAMFARETLKLRNTETRGEIVKLFRRTTCENYIQILHSPTIKKLNYIDRDRIQKLVQNAIQFNKLTSLVSNFKSGVYEFDTGILEACEKTHDKIKQMIVRRIGNKISHRVSELGGDLPHYISQCGDYYYCDKRRHLIVPREDYDVILDIIAQQIKTGIKGNTLLYNIPNLIGEFKFTTISGESITIVELNN